MRLHNKIALVTGAARGIEKSITQLFHKNELLLLSQTLKIMKAKF